MKKLFLALLLFSAGMFAQDRGRISMIFNNEKMDLPIKSITINKQDKIFLDARAEFNNDSLQQMIGLQLVFNKLSPVDKEGLTLEGTKINIFSRKHSSGSDLQITFWSKDEAATYSFSRNKEKVSYEINSLSMKLGIEKIEFNDDELIITGHLDGTFKSIQEDGKNRKEVATIKDGKFEIVL